MQKYLECFFDGVIYFEDSVGIHCTSSMLQLPSINEKGGNFRLKMADLIDVMAAFPLGRPQNLILATPHMRNLTHSFPDLSSRSRALRCVTAGVQPSGGEVFSVTSSSKSIVDYLGESTKGDMNVKEEHLEAFGELFLFFFIYLF